MTDEISFQPLPAGSPLRCFATVFLLSSAGGAMLAAVALVRRERELMSVAHRLKRSFEFERISVKRPHAPTNLPLRFVGRFLVRNDRVVTR